MFARKYPIVPWRTPLRSACLTALSQAPLGGASYCYAIFDVPFFERCVLPIHRGAAAAWHWRGARYRTIAGAAVGSVSYY